MKKLVARRAIDYLPVTMVYQQNEADAHIRELKERLTGARDLLGAVTDWLTEGDEHRMYKWMDKVDAILHAGEE